MFFSCSRATPSISSGFVHARMSAFRPRIRCMGSTYVQGRHDAGGESLALRIRLVRGPGPEEAAQAVALSPGNHVRVQVRHALGDLRVHADERPLRLQAALDRKSTRLNSSHLVISYAVFCLKKK